MIVFMRVTKEGCERFFISGVALSLNDLFMSFVLPIRYFY